MRGLLLTVAAINLSILVSYGADGDLACPRSENSLKIAFTRKFNLTDGQWMTALSVNGSNPLEEKEIEATHGFSNCSDGTGRYHFKVIVRDGGTNQSLATKPVESDLYFHPRHTFKVRLFNGGRSARRIGSGPLSEAVFTSRPLRDNEVFAVRIVKRTNSTCDGIGVTRSPDDFDFSKPVFQKGSWLIKGRAVFGDGDLLLRKYGLNTCTVKVGDTIGVIRKTTGSLHFLLNGKDYGPAANVPNQSTLYGLYHLTLYPHEVTIVSKH